MSNAHGSRSGQSYAEVQTFADVVGQWLGRRTRAEGARELRVSLRTVRYWLDGKTKPNGSTLALVERSLARGAGMTVDQVRAAAGHLRGAGYAESRNAKNDSPAAGES